MNTYTIYGKMVADRHSPDEVWEHERAQLTALADRVRQSGGRVCQIMDLACSLYVQMTPDMAAHYASDQFVEEIIAH